MILPNTEASLAVTTSTGWLISLALHVNLTRTEMALTASTTLYSPSSYWRSFTSPISGKSGRQYARVWSLEWDQLAWRFRHFRSSCNQLSQKMARREIIPLQTPLLPYIAKKSSLKMIKWTKTRKSRPSMIMSPIKTGQKRSELGHSMPVIAEKL